jgi:hypothetical protein
MTNLRLQVLLAESSVALPTCDTVWDVTAATSGVMVPQGAADSIDRPAVPQCSFPWALRDPQLRREEQHLITASLGRQGGEQSTVMLHECKLHNGPAKDGPFSQWGPDAPCFLQHLKSRVANFWKDSYLRKSLPANMLILIPRNKCKYQKQPNKRILEKSQWNDFFLPTYTVYYDTTHKSWVTESAKCLSMSFAEKWN